MNVRAAGKTEILGENRWRLVEMRFLELKDAGSSSSLEQTPTEESSRRLSQKTFKEDFQRRMPTREPLESSKISGFKLVI